MNAKKIGKQKAESRNGRVFVGLTQKELNAMVTAFLRASEAALAFKFANVLKEFGKGRR